MFKMKWISPASVYRRLMTWIAHTSINRRLLLASVIVAIIPGLVISLLGSALIQALNDHGRTVQVSTDAVKVATTELANLQQMNANLIALQAEQFAGITVNESQDVRINQLGQDMNKEIKTLQATCKQTLIIYQQNYQISTSDNMASVRNQLTNDQALSTIQKDQQNTLARVKNQEWKAYTQAQSLELQALQSNQPSAETYQLLIAANDKFAPLEQDWNHIVDLAETVSDNVAQVDATHKVYFTIFGIVAGLIILFVVVVIGYMVNLTIARPLSDLVKLTKRISGGDTTARIAIKGNDEIDMVAESVNKMMDNIVQLIQEVQIQRNTLQAKIEKLGTEVRVIGEGNLQVQPEVTPDTLGALAIFFNDMIEALGGLVIRVKMASREVEASTTVTLTMLAQLVKTSDMQLQETAVAMKEVEQMANSSRQVAERTRMLYGVVHDAQSAIEKGRISVQQAIAGMKRIQDNVYETATKVQKLGNNSNEINDINTVISTIAQQMRGLAQDAAMQASLVGEHGKGFAVVASDIQRLAERTASQVGSIAQIIQGVHEDIGSATLSMQNTERESAHSAKLAQEASDSLETIFAAADLQAREMDFINHTTIQQLQVFNAIENIMHLISQSTQQVSTTTHTVAQNLGYLTRYVEELRISVEAFKLRQTSPVLWATADTDPMTPVPPNVSQLLKSWNTIMPFPDADSSRWALPKG